MKKGSDMPWTRRAVLLSAGALTGVVLWVVFTIWMERCAAEELREYYRREMAEAHDEGWRETLEKSYHFPKSRELLFLFWRDFLPTYSL